MVEKDIPNQGLGITPSDVLKAVFRYKWLIVFCFFVGIAVSAAIYVTQKPVYRSTAKLVVLYVVERRDMMGFSEGEQIRAPDSRGDNIINTELEILRSWDLALKVADAIGPEKLVSDPALGTNRNRAAGTVAKGIKTDVPRKSNIIAVSYEHPDREIPPLVLRELVDRYLAKHFEIHRAVASFDFLAKQTDEARARLSTAEEDLRQLKNRANIISLEDSRRAIADQLNLLRRSIYEAEALKAERRAAMPSTAGPATGTEATNEVVTVSTPAPEEIALYKRICDRLRSLQDNELHLLGNFTGENPLVIGVRKQIAEVQKQKKDLEQVSSGLLLVDAPRPSAKPSGETPWAAHATEAAHLVSIEAKIRVLTNQLEQVKREAKAFDEVENQILQTQRQRDMEEAKLKNLETSLEQARIDSALDSSKMSNISLVQAPSPPLQDSSVRTKAALIAVGGGLGLGLALALVLELLVDHSVRKATELEKRFRLPVFLSIPAVTLDGSRDGGSRKRLGWMRRSNKKGLADQLASEPLPASYSLWEAPRELRPFCEGLRDRLLLHFENVTRRPKIIGLSGCAPGSGTTTLAAGLAAALSETRDGNVLLVDLNLDRGTAHPFCRGKALCGLAETLEQEKRGEALVQDNLFLATAASSNGDVHPVLSKKVVDLMPRLRASDYDYIIFDLPPISPTSITFRLAGYMDLMLMVVESGKTQRHVVKDAVSLLSHAKAKMGAILNKHRSPVPLWLHYGS